MENSMEMSHIKIRKKLPCDPDLPLQVFYTGFRTGVSTGWFLHPEYKKNHAKGHLHTTIHCSTYYGSYKMESMYVSNDGWINTEGVIYRYIFTPTYKIKHNVAFMEYRLYYVK